MYTPANFLKNLNFGADKKTFQNKSGLKTRIFILKF